VDCGLFLSGKPRAFRAGGFTGEDLAFLVGAHRVSVTRASKELKKEGSVVQLKRRLLVRNG
jgi:CRP-like cAMP-binding protein